MSASRCVGALVTAFAALTIARAVEAQSTGDLVVRCQHDARTALSGVRASVDTIWFGDTPRVSSALNMGAQVAGAGIVHDFVTREWRRFLYSCAWMPNTFQAAVSIRVDSAAFRR